MKRDINIIGNRYGDLTVISECEERGKYGHTMFLCHCDCGNEVAISGTDLRQGKRVSCGCRKRELRDLTGQRFGRLVVLAPVLPLIKRQDTSWICLCDCGRKVKVKRGNLIDGYTKSCGCLKHEINVSRIGDKNPSWKPELTDADREYKRITPVYKEWREVVFVKDNWTCQKCRQYGGNLNAHHIEGYAGSVGLRTAVNNGSTLCKACHREYHHRCGMNSGRKEYEEWLNEKRC